MKESLRENNRWNVRTWLKLSLVWVMALQVTLGAWSGIIAAADVSGEAVSEVSIKKQVDEAVAALQEILSRTTPISDWAAFGLARSDQVVANSYLAVASKSTQDGSLTKVTDFARVALAVNANGGNAGEVGPDKTNLLAKIANYEKITAQGPNAPAYALLALDAAAYVEAANDRWSRDDLIKWLIEQRQPDGGWTLVPGKSDVDVTSIVLTALAPYKAQEAVGPAIDGALSWLSSVQRETAGFGNPMESSESSVQVLIALTSLGIDPTKDTRFLKNNKSTIARLLEYRLQDGRFAHLPAGKANDMATFYALLGLTAVQRWMDGLPGLYSGVTTTAKSQVTVNGINGQLATGAATGKTALEALIQVLKKTNITYKVDQHPQFGALLSSLSGVDNGKFGGYDGWQYAVKRNGTWVSIAEGMGTFTLERNDELYVYYGDSETTLIHSVQAEPTAPREGQPITVTVEKEVLDWETGITVVSPAAGAQVKVGTQTVLTDKDGKAQLEGMKSGSYDLTVDGYRKGLTPQFVAFQSKLEVASYVKKVAVRIEGDAGMLITGTAQGGTALEAIEQLTKTNGVALEIKEMSFGKYINAIGGITSGKYGGFDGWYFAVMRGGQWIVPSEGVSTFLLEEGDEVVVYYSGGDATKLVDPVVLSKPQPKPGEGFTVLLTNSLWNWETNGFDAPLPLAGVKVKIGNIETVTDHNGQVQVAGLSEGVYTIEVTGYEKAGAPTVVRSSTELLVAGTYTDQGAIAPWALEAVRESKAAGLLRGMGDGSSAFKPKQAVTRGEFVSALVRSLDLKVNENGNGIKAFKDVPAGAWYAKEVEAAAVAGLVSGVAAGQFAPEATLTREQAAILLTRALKLKATSATAVLKDGKRVSPIAVTAVQAVMQHGWMTSYEGNFSPKASLSREQAAIIAVRILGAGLVAH